MGLLSSLGVIFCGMDRSRPVLVVRFLALLTAVALLDMSGGAKGEVPLVIPITDTAALKASVGKSVTVTGKVSRVGMSKSGFIVFINFEGVPSGGFSAVVKSANLTEIEWAAGANLDLALPGRLIAVSGVISLYKEAPQIELKSASQIRVSGMRSAG